MEVIVRSIFPDGDDDGGKDDKEELDGEGSDEDPAAARGKEAMEAAEKEGPETEGDD